MASCSEGLDEYALETAHVDQVYGESPPACGIETLRGSSVLPDG